MRRDIGPHGLALVKGFESFVPYVYDDLVPMRHDERGHLAYPEYTGGPVRGTLTIGYGHTDAARHPLKCHVGTRVSEAEALEILHTDLSECIAYVNDHAHVPLTQGQFDALVSFTFNCGSGNTAHLIVPLNRGDYDTTRADFGHYVRSKGQVLRGLERRRHAEQVLWDDDYEALHAEHLPTHGEHVQHPAEVDARPPRVTERAPAPAHVGLVATTATVAAGGEILTQVNSTLSTAKDTKQTAGELLEGIALSPGVLLGIALLVGVVVLWLSHHRKAA